MSVRKPAVDKIFFVLATILIGVGFVVFISASLGLLARDGAGFGPVVLKQFFIGLCLGTASLLFFSYFDYRRLRPLSFYFFIFAALLTLAVFIPGLGFEHGGARRWLSLGGFTFQPSELLKLGYVMYIATWLSGVRQKVTDFRLGLAPFLIISGIVGVILILQRDTDTLFITLLAGLAMFLVAGARWKQVAVIGLLAIVAAGTLVAVRPYLLERIQTFVNLSAADPRGAGWQVEQSLVAIGSGGWTGRGFGQSVQKFQYLPEPIGDSIFAVAGEEFGFFGASFLVIMFLLFALRGLRIAASSPDMFGRLLGVGIVVLIIVQSFINMASMLALFPLSGTPLVFISQGGTALFIALVEVGILLSISRLRRST